MASLPSTTSIVDFLNSQGKDSSFGARRNLFNQAGLDKRLGSFSGSANQNLTLLKNLQGGGSPSKENPQFFTPGLPNAQEAETNSASKFFDSPVMQPFKDGLNFGTQTTTPQTNIQEEQPFNLQDIINKSTREFSLADGLRENVGEGRQSEFDQKSSTLPFITPPSAKAPATARDTVEAFGRGTPERIAQEDEARDKRFGLAPGTTAAKRAGTTSTQQSQERDTQTKSELGFSASDVLGSQSSRSESDLVNDYLSSAEGKLFLEKQELSNLTASAKAASAKAELESKFASDKESLENNLAGKGLAFSGIRGTQVKALSESLATSLMGEDRKLATLLLESDIKFRETVLDGVADLIKSASDDNKDAIAQLNKAGYAVIGDQLVPTLARENATIDDIRADANLAISQRRLEIAEQTNARAAAKLANGDADKESDFSVFLSLLADDDSEGTDSEYLLWGLQNTDLSKSELQSALATNPKSAAALTVEAATLIEDNFTKKKLSSRSAELAEAKKQAKKAVMGFGSGEFATTAERDSLLEMIDSLTLDDISI